MLTTETLTHRPAVSTRVHLARVMAHYAAVVVPASAPRDADRAHDSAVRFGGA